jgi:hypothetical protein
MVAGGGEVKMTENKIHWSLWYVLYKQRWAALFFRSPLYAIPLLFFSVRQPDS